MKQLLNILSQVMKNSGCEVPSYMLTMKKGSRDDRKKLATRAPKRDGISQISKYEKDKIRKKEEMIAASKKRKLEGRTKRSKKVKKKKMNIPTEIDEDSDDLSDASIDQ